MSNFRAFILVAAGAALSAGCSDGVPPAAEGAYRVKFVSNGGSCTLKTHDDAVGHVTDDNFGLIKDGTQATDVTCLVIDEGGSFYAEGIISGENGARSLQFSVAGLKPGQTADDPAFGRASFLSKATLEPFISPNEEPCRFWFASGKQQVAAGRLWVSFHCPVITNGGRECGLGQAPPQVPATIAVQNCDQ